MKDILIDELEHKNKDVEKLAKPTRLPGISNKQLTLLDFIKREKEVKLPGGIYHRVKVE